MSEIERHVRQFLYTRDYKAIETEKLVYNLSRFLDGHLKVRPSNLPDDPTKTENIKRSGFNILGFFRKKEKSLE